MTYKEDCKYKSFLVNITQSDQRRFNASAYVEKTFHWLCFCCEFFLHLSALYIWLSINLTFFILLIILVLLALSLLLLILLYCTLFH